MKLYGDKNNLQLVNQNVWDLLHWTRSKKSYYPRNVDFSSTLFDGNKKISNYGPVLCQIPYSYTKPTV